MAQRRLGHRGGHLLLGLVGVLGAMRLMAERMEVGFAGWKMDQMGLGPGALLRLRRTGSFGHSRKLEEDLVQTTVSKYFQLSCIQ